MTTGWYGIARSAIRQPRPHVSAMARPIDRFAGARAV